jgi:hypothetical protein
MRRFERRIFLYTPDILIANVPIGNEDVGDDRISTHGTAGQRPAATTIEETIWKPTL